MHRGIGLSGSVDSYLLPSIAIFGAFVVAILILLATQTNKITLFSKKKTIPKNTESSGKKETAEAQLETITPKHVQKIKEDLRILTLEKEVVSYALTRLYEAEAEGKITKDDQTQLLDKYKTEMKELQKRIQRKKMIIKLHELKGTQTELIQMFNKRLNEIKDEISNIRTSLGLEQKKEILKERKIPSTPSTQKPNKEKVEQKEIPESENKKSISEQKLEQIQEEVLKVLERLEQIETET